MLGGNQPIIFVIGYGSIGRRHCDVIHTVIPDSKIYIVHHKTPTNKNYQKFITGAFESYEEALYSEIIPDIVFICNPSPYHVSTAFRFSMKKPKGIFIEKPVSNSDVTQVKRLLEYCKSLGIIFQVGYQLRFSILNQIKSIIDAGKLGKICSVQINFGEYLPGWRPLDNYKNGVTANADLGGGVLLEISHELDYLCWLFGNPFEIIGCSAGKRSNLEIDVEDTVDILLDYHSFTLNLHIDMIDRLKNRSLKIVGTNGSLLWESPGESVTGKYKLTVMTTDQTNVFEDKSRNEIMQLQLKHFISRIQSAELTTNLDGVNALQLIEKIKRKYCEYSLP